VGALVFDYPEVFIKFESKQLFSIKAEPSKTFTLPVKLSSGSNEIVFRPVYGGNVVPNSNGDPRILLVGIKLMKVTVDDF
jgi:hypothetical protein